MKSILLLEPDKVLSRTYTNALIYAGFKVVEAYTAQDAIQAADHQCPHAVVLELRLAGLNGIAFLQEFRSYPEWQSIPVIVNSYVVLDTAQTLKAILLRDFEVATCLYKPQTSLQRFVSAIKEQVG